MLLNLLDISVEPRSILVYIINVSRTEVGSSMDKLPIVEYLIRIVERNYN